MLNIHHISAIYIINCPFPSSTSSFSSVSFINWTHPERQHCVNCKMTLMVLPSGNVHYNMWPIACTRSKFSADMNSTWLKPSAFPGISQFISPSFSSIAPHLNRARLSLCYTQFKLLYSYSEKLNWICSVLFQHGKMGLNACEGRDKGVNSVKSDESETHYSIDNTPKQSRGN